MNRNRVIMTDFTFHNVGQGLFYSGRIEDFNFIYDCGSENKTHLQYVISDYKRNKLRDSRIDLLVLSHLHSDHISGLADLLDNDTMVDTVMLPYLSPMERLMVSLDGKNPPEWLRRFWADPISYLVDKGARRVVLFGNNEASSPEDVRLERYLENRENKIDVNRLENDEKLESEVKEKEKKKVSYLFEAGRLLAKKHNLSLPVTNSWLFRFFNLKLDDENKMLFEQCVNKKFPNEDASDIVRDRAKLKILKTCYDKLAGNFNNTSLVLYHMPADNGVFQTQLFHFCSCMLPSNHSIVVQNPNKATIYLGNSVGHLLSGDIDFKNNWGEIERHFRPYLSLTNLALVPHHGSRQNWNNAALNRLTNTCCWIISAGSSNGYGHPDPSVCHAIVSSGSRYQRVNEGTEISIRNTMYL